MFQPKSQDHEENEYNPKADLSCMDETSKQVLIWLKSRIRETERVSQKRGDGRFFMENASLAVEERVYVGRIMTIAEPLGESYGLWHRISP